MRCLTPSWHKTVDSLWLRYVAPSPPIFPHHGSPFASTAPPTPTPASIATPRPAVERAPSLQRTTATCERDSRTASQTTSARASRRNARAAIRRAWGGVGRPPLRCDSAFFESIIAAVAITILAPGRPLPPPPPRGPAPLSPTRRRARRPAVDPPRVESTSP